MPAGSHQLCVSSDLIFVANDAQIGFPSIPAGAGYVSAFWNWMVGPHRTKYLAFLPGSRISGKEAEAMGFATRAFPAGGSGKRDLRLRPAGRQGSRAKTRLEKLAINRAMDLRGFRVSVQAGAEFDAIFHFGPGNEGDPASPEGAWFPRGDHMVRGKIESRGHGSGIVILGPIGQTVHTPLRRMGAMEREHGMQRTKVNGAELAYELPGDGPPLVMIHGAQGDQSMFNDLAPVFPAAAIAS